MCGFAQYVFYAILNVNNKKKKAKKILNIKKSTKSKFITVPASTILEIWELPIHIHIFFILSYSLIYCLNFLNFLVFMLHAKYISQLLHPLLTKIEIY